MTSEETQFQLSGDRRRAAELSQQHTQPPTAVPGYQAQRFLGAGAYGEVWVAIDKNTGRQVAIKFFEHRTGVNWSMLSREVEKLVFLTADRYVVQLLEVGWDADPPYYVMEYAENGSLDDRLVSRGPIAVTEAVDMFRDVVIGMSHAHGKGVLHCDLKPANVLLDQDEKPRIADFGQARLTSEQKPALGTLFYMPPEQASLDSMPDARWDVYALGALLYSMILGRPPYRSGEAVSEIDSSSSLADRLKKYRKYITSALAITDHRKVKGVDRALSDIIEKCLAVNPANRFQSVLRILDALDERENARVRRPLQLLGIVGPLLLLLIVGVFGYRAYEQAIKRSESMAIVKSHESNRFAAKAVAKVVGSHIEKRYSILEQVNQDNDFSALVQTLVTDGTAADVLDLLGNRGSTDGSRLAARSEFRRLPLRRELQSYMESLINNPRYPGVASWFVTDAKGTMLAAAFPKPVRSPVGNNYMHRTYFHGGLKDDSSREFQPLADIQLSTPFISTATNTYKVAISAPIRIMEHAEEVNISQEKSEEVTVGVLAVTLELGDFVEFEETSLDFCAMLIDGRPNEFQGIVFQHPLYAEVPRPQGVLPIDISHPDYRADLSALCDAKLPSFFDPLGQHELGAQYQGEWIASAAPVTFTRFNNEEQDTGLVLAVERRLSSVTSPVSQLAKTLFREALAALVVVSIVSAALWYFVLRMMRGSFQAARRGAAAGDALTSVHSRDTLTMPAATSDS